MDRTIKIGILTGIIASMVFVYFLDPILRAFGDTVVYSSSWVYSGLIDSMYEKSALGEPRDPALTIFTMLAGGFMGLFTGLVSFFFRRRKPASEDASSNKSWPKLLVIPIALLAFMFTFQTWALLFQHQIITSFGQHMRIVAPFITETEEEILISKYARMRSEDDYEAMYEQLRSISKGQNIELPENPTYEFWTF